MSLSGDADAEECSGSFRASWHPRNVRYLGDSCVEIFQGDSAGTFEIVKVQQPTIPRGILNGSHRWSLLERDSDCTVRCVDFLENSPFTAFGTDDGRVGVCNVELNCEIPFSDVRFVWDCPGTSSVSFCRLGQVDQAMIAVGLHGTADSNDQLTVLDMARGSGMKEPGVVFQKSCHERLCDAVWLRRHPSLLAVSSDKALRILDIRTPNASPISLFHQGPARLLTDNKFRTNLLAAVVRDQIHLYDCRKLFGPLEKFDPGREFNNCPIDSLKWHPREPNELSFSSRMSNVVGKMDTTYVTDCFDTRSSTLFDKEDVVSIEKVWGNELDESFIKKRLERYPLSADVGSLPTYGEQFDLCRTDPDCFPPTIVVGDPPQIRTQRESSPPPNKTPASSGFTFIEDEPMDEPVTTKMDRLKSHWKALLDGVSEKEESPMDFNENQLSQLSSVENLNAAQFADSCRKILLESGFEEHIVEKVCQLILEVDSPCADLSPELLNELIALVIKTAECSYETKSLEDTSPALLGKDYGTAYVLDCAVDGFAFPPIGCSGILVLTRHAARRLAYIPSLTSDCERPIPNIFSEKVHAMNLREVYDLTPPEVWDSVDQRLKKDGYCKGGRKFARRNLILRLSELDSLEGGHQPPPWWLIWTRGSAEYYEGPVDNELVRFVTNRAREDKYGSKKSMSRIEDASRKTTFSSYGTTDGHSRSLLAGANERPRSSCNPLFPVEDSYADSEAADENASTIVPDENQLDEFLLKEQPGRSGCYEFNGFDMKIKGFPGLLQLSSLECQNEKESIVSSDVTFFSKVKLYMSAHRHRILLPFGLAFDDVECEMVDYEDCEDMGDYYDLLFSSLLHGKFGLFHEVLEEMYTRFGEAERRNMVDFYPIQYLEKFVELTKKLIQISKFHDSESLESHDARMEWVDEVDEFIHEQLGKDGADAHLLPIVRVLRCAVTGQQPQDYTNHVIFNERIPLPHRILWLVTLCDADTLHQKAIQLAQQTEGLDRLIYYGIGRHTDCLAVITDYLSATHDWQLVSHLLIAARVFEDNTTVFDKWHSILRKSYKLSARPGALPKRARSDRKRRTARYMNIDPRDSSSVKALRNSVDTMPGLSRLCLYLQRNGRMAPAFHMNEVFSVKYLPDPTPIECLLSVAEMAVVRYLYVLAAHDHPFFRFHLLRIIGSEKFKKRHVDLLRFEMRCIFCGFTRSKSTKPRRTFDPEQEKKRRVIKERADRRRLKFSVARQERVERGEPASYVPPEDINGSLAASEIEIKWPPPTACPQCRRPYPKCMICHKIDRTPSKVKHSSGFLADHFTICKVCHHGGHVQHIVEWFKREDFCAVNGCDCKCARQPPSDLTRLWREDMVAFKQKKTYQY